MRVTLTIQGDEVRKAKPLDDRAIVEGECPKCKHTPFAVAGTGMSIESHDTYRADAACLSCRERVGVLRTKMETLFGLEEDERVLSGPWKVY